MNNYNYDDKYDNRNNDPIQEVGLNIFVRSKSFEDNDEYQIEKDMKRYQEELRSYNSQNDYDFIDPDTLSSQNNYSNNPVKNTSSEFAVIFFSLLLVGFTLTMTIFMLSISLNPIPVTSVKESEYTTTSSEIEQLEMDFISFSSHEKIPALELYCKASTPTGCTYRKCDTRISEKANIETIQLTYSNYTPTMKNIYTRALKNDENYTEYIINTNGNKVYIMETPNSFLFVFPMKNSIIYGKGHGDYLSILGIE